MNNHIDMLETLAKLNLGNRQVIVPLSYGDMTYAQQVIEAGKRLLGSRFRPLVDFLELEEYRKIVLSCNMMIMNHIQERGFGTLMMALNNGLSAVLRQGQCNLQHFNAVEPEDFLHCGISRTEEFRSNRNDQCRYRT